MDRKSGKSPREFQFADKFGNYGLVARTSSDIMDPGETLVIELYISGYGSIESSKLIFYPSPGVVDSDDKDSYVLFGIHGKKGLGVWGAQRHQLHPDGNAIGFTGGAYKSEWKSPSIFFDINETQISTEKKLGGFAPIHINLKTKRKARAGTHSIQFLFTYFDGSNWQTSSNTVQFTIRNFFQRYDRLFLTLGAFATGLAIIIALKTIISWFIPFLADCFAK